MCVSVRWCWKCWRTTATAAVSLARRARWLRRFARTPSPRSRSPSRCPVQYTSTVPSHSDLGLWLGCTVQDRGHTQTVVWYTVCCHLAAVLQSTVYRVGPQTWLFSRGDNYAAVTDSKVCNMSEVSKFCIEKCVETLTYNVPSCPFFWHTV